MALALAFLGLSCVMPAQARADLVPNPSFETYTAVPTGQDQLNLAYPWSNPTSANPDFFNPSCPPYTTFPLNLLPPEVGVPTNSQGTQTPQTGSCYAGFYASGGVTGNGPWREYIETPLTSPLVAGQMYRVEFSVSLADECQCAVDQLGAYLSNGPVGPVNTQQCLTGITPQVTNPSGHYLTNKTGWELFSQTFTASGGEDHLVIGNFSDEASTPLMTGLSGSRAGAYYYIDDVSVTPQEQPPPTPHPWWQHIGPWNIGIMFSSVTKEGMCAAHPADPGSDKPPGYSAVTNTCFDISTTATYSGTTTVTVPYDPANVQGDPHALRLYHFTGGSWHDVSASVDTVNHTVSGTTSSFSPFAIFQPDGSGGGSGLPRSNTPASSSWTLAAFAILALGAAALRRGIKPSR